MARLVALKHLRCCQAGLCGRQRWMVPLVRITRLVTFAWPGLGLHNYFRGDHYVSLVQM